MMPHGTIITQRIKVSQRKRTRRAMSSGTTGDTGSGSQRDFGPYANEKGELQLCFLSNNDITGGNSGSPVFDKNARLIGLAFDGNWEAMSGDIAFEPDLQRCIGVDIRYVLFMIDKWGKCPRLIEELKLVR